ncbi:MAG: hypothetical protein ACRDTB_27845 [Actinophytocola sp.]
MDGDPRTELGLGVLKVGLEPIAARVPGTVRRSSSSVPGTVRVTGPSTLTYRIVGVSGPRSGPAKTDGAAMCGCARNRSRSDEVNGMPRTYAAPLTGMMRASRPLWLCP